MTVTWTISIYSAFASGLARAFRRLREDDQSDELNKADGCATETLLHLRPPVLGIDVEIQLLVGVGVENKTIYHLFVALLAVAHRCFGVGVGGPN